MTLAIVLAIVGHALYQEPDGEQPKWGFNKIGGVGFLMAAVIIARLIAGGSIAP